MYPMSIATPYSINAPTATYSWDLGGKRSAWFAEMNQPKLVIMAVDLMDTYETAKFPEFYKDGNFDEAAFDAALDALFADYDDGFELVEDESDLDTAQQMLGSIGIKC